MPFIKISLTTFVALDHIKMCLLKQKDIFHPLNIQHIQTIEIALVTAVDQEYWEDADTFGIRLLPGYL
jgi:SET and MYND domain-containing protein